MIITTVFEGDSMSYAQSIPAWTYQACGFTAPLVGFGEGNPVTPRFGWRHHASEGRIFCNHALSSSRLQDYTPSIADRVATLDALIDPNYTPVSGRSERAYILVMMVGTNQHVTNGYTHAADVGTFCLARQARGFRVLLCTLPNRTDGFAARWNDYASEYHTTIKGAGWAAAHGVSQIIDVASIAEVGATGAADNTTYFEADKVHMKFAAHELIGALVETHINLEIADILS